MSSLRTAVIDLRAATSLRWFEKDGFKNLKNFIICLLKVFLNNRLTTRHITVHLRKKIT